MVNLGLVSGGIYRGVYQPLETHASQIFSEFQGLGAKWVRIEYGWNDIKDVSLYQRIAKAAHAKGLKVLVLLDKEYGGDDNKPEQIDPFIASYITELETMLNTVFLKNTEYRADAIEIGNEPNNPKPHKTNQSITGNAFAWLLARVWDWAKRNNRPELIVSGGILNTYCENSNIGGDQIRIESWWQAFFNSGMWGQYRGKRPFDFMGIHPYNPYSINIFDIVNQGTPGPISGYYFPSPPYAVPTYRTDIFAHWKDVTKTTLQHLGTKIDNLTGMSNTQFFVTEFGWQMPKPPSANSSYPERRRVVAVDNMVTILEQAASGMEAAVQAFRESGRVNTAFWYDYRNDPPTDSANLDTVKRFGLRSSQTGNNYPAKLPVWNQFKKLAGGQGSSDPESYWT
ncbi:hypothetical protein [Calothrix sp. PCC 7507]|uniref:hypothetical protein n=1 Tax=Calothrix sp. PCC 7507 TaxID=99598 RepID=UPI00029F345E|nr:hypothetical protein [Calothrix sp. PCC 7507]AFY34644.1 hypothetical protein Cal7507_4268 [Calothrix sp. PCC 7507]